MIYQINVVMKMGGDIFIDAESRERAQELAQELINNGTHNISGSDLYPEDVEILFVDEAKKEEVDEKSLEENMIFISELDN